MLNVSFTQPQAHQLKTVTTKSQDISIRDLKALGNPLDHKKSHYSCGLWEQVEYTKLEPHLRNRLNKLPLDIPLAQGLLKTLVHEQEWEAVFGLLIWMSSKNIIPDHRVLTGILSTLVHHVYHSSDHTNIALFIKYCVCSGISIEVSDDIKQCLATLPKGDKWKPWIDIIQTQSQAAVSSPWSALLTHLSSGVSAPSEEAKQALAGLQKYMRLHQFPQEAFIKLYRDCLLLNFPLFYACLYNEDSGRAHQTEAPIKLKRIDNFLTSPEGDTTLCHQIYARHTSIYTFQALIDAKVPVPLHDLVPIDGRNPLAVAIEKAIDNQEDITNFTEALADGLKSGLVTPKPDWTTICDMLVQKIDEKKSHSLIVKEINLLTILSKAIGSPEKYTKWLDQLAQETIEHLIPGIPPDHDSVAVVLIRDEANSFSDGYYEWFNRSPKKVSLFSRYYQTCSLVHEKGPEHLSDKTSLYVIVHGNRTCFNYYSPRDFADFLSKQLSKRCVSLPDHIVLVSCKTGARINHKEESAAETFSRAWQEITRRRATIVAYDELVSGNVFEGLEVQSQRKKRKSKTGHEVFIAATESGLSKKTS